MIITDHNHRRHRDPVENLESARPEIKTDFVLTLNEEDFKAKEFEGLDQPAKAVP